MNEGQKKLLGGVMDNVVLARLKLELTARCKQMGDDELWMAQGECANELEAAAAQRRRPEEGAPELLEVIRAEVQTRQPGFAERALKLVMPRMGVPDLEESIANAERVKKTRKLTAEQAEYGKLLIRMMRAELAKRAVLR